MKKTLIAALSALVAAVLLVGCAGIPQDGRYQTHGGGWDNFRAEAPVAERMA